MATMTILAFVLGILLVMQLRAQEAAGGLEHLSAQDLTQLIANLNVQNGQLRAQADDLDAQLRSITQATANGSDNVGQLRADLRRLRLWGGLDPVQGRGVVVAIDGPIRSRAVNDLLDELRLAGAEALAVGEVRVVPGSIVAEASNGLSIEGTAIGERFTVQAIGSPEALKAILERSGGIISRIVVAQPDVAIDVTESDLPLELPATTRRLAPADAKPRH